MIKWLLLLSAITWAQVSGSAVYKEIATHCGSVVGVKEFSFLGESVKGVWSFKGIPYAEPPERWRATKLIEPKSERGCWEEPFPAFHFGAPCVQKDLMGSENCLFVNVWTADPTVLRPVVVFIHGGGLMNGHGGDKRLNPSRIVRQGDVVAVTLNYRLNVFGFLAVDLPDKKESDIRANYGLHDQIIALQRNIKEFGGDPAAITVYGQGSGGTSVYALLSTRFANDLFHRAIIFSANAKIEATFENAAKMHHDSWINNTKCIEYVEEKTELSECLKKLSHAEILNAIPDTWIDTSPPSNWGIPESYSITPQAPLLIADGKLVVSQLNRTVVNDIFGNFKAIDIAIGFTAEEVDSDPMDILVGYNDKEFSAFLEAKFQKFNISKEDILSWYPLIDYLSPQQCYDQISSDIHVICPNLELATTLARKQGRPFYVYMLSQRTDHHCDYETAYCPAYAYHMYDLDVLNYNSEYLGRRDIALGNSLMKSLTEFISKGKVTGWTYYKSNDNLQVNIVNPKEPKTAPRLKEAICAWWKAQQFDKFSRIN